MFYVSSASGGLIQSNLGTCPVRIGVTDTNDGVEEFYSNDDIVNFLLNNVRIYGARVEKINGYLYAFVKPIKCPFTKLKSVQKTRDSNDKIVSYTLKDANGQTVIIDADLLKRYIRENSLDVVNLTLTSDNRLLDKQTPAATTGTGITKGSGKPTIIDYINRGKQKGIKKLSLNGLLVDTGTYEVEKDNSIAKSKAMDSHNTGVVISGIPIIANSADTATDGTPVIANNGTKDSSFDSDENKAGVVNKNSVSEAEFNEVKNNIIILTDLVTKTFDLVKFNKKKLPDEFLNDSGFLNLNFVGGLRPKQWYRIEGEPVCVEVKLREIWSSYTYADFCKDPDDLLFSCVLDFGLGDSDYLFVTSRYSRPDTYIIQSAENIYSVFKTFFDKTGLSKLGIVGDDVYIKGTFQELMDKLYRIQFGLE